jgi:protein gp37
MSENSKIEWTDHTFNPWEGCTKVGPGCDHCYAETRNARYAGGESINWGSGVPRRRTSESNWRKPIKWNAEADAFFAEYGRRQRVFCASLADVFDNEVDPQWRIDLLELIAQTPNLDWLLLTKRVGNVAAMLDSAIETMAHGINDWTDYPWPNVWIGATICNQEEADRDIPKLLQAPAAVRFLSMEPLLGPVNLVHLNDGREAWEINALKAWTWEQEIDAWHGTSDEWEDDFKDWFNLSEMPSGPMHNALDWVIVGGESGPKARPMHPDWAHSLRDQCAAFGVPFLFKQWGEWADLTNEPPGSDMRKAACEGFIQTADKEVLGAGNRHGGMVEENWKEKGGAWMGRVGKKTAGRLLDGRTHDEFPRGAA